MITIKNLQFSYAGSHQPALSGVDLNIQDQNLFGLLGPNGAGKTTLLSILSGLLRCPANTVFIDDCDIASSDTSWKSTFSLVPQEYAFYSELTVAENLSFFAAAQGINFATLKTRLAETAEITGLTERLQHKASTLSGGLKRRLNLAIGLLNRPRLLLLDEPTVGIDPHSRHFILETIKHINQQGTTVIYTSHYMEEVEALCDQIAIIDNGSVLVQGALSELLHDQKKQTLTVDLNKPASTAQLKALSQNRVFSHQPLQLIFDIHSNKDVLAVLAELNELKLETNQINYGRGNLETLFLNLTQRSLRD